jgi:hypothetical protein
VTAPTTKERQVAVHVGGFVVAADADGFVLMQARRAEEREARELRNACARVDSPSVLERAEERVADLDDLTADLERGGRVVEQLAGGLDPQAVAEELEELLGSFRERCRQGRARDAARLAEVLVTAFLLARRWAVLVDVLRDTLGVAQAAGDIGVEAWASEALGTLAAAAGAPAAGDLLGQAYALYEQLGDHAGAELASKNLAAAGHGAPASVGTKVGAWVSLHKVVAVAIGATVAASAAAGVVLVNRGPPSPSPPPRTVLRPLTGAFVIPAGHAATISDVRWKHPCDALGYGYRLGSGDLVTLASKPAGCISGEKDLPGKTIGPFSSDMTLRIFLTDTGYPAGSCRYTFYSDGSHALVTGSNPWHVDITDGVFCTKDPNADVAPAKPGFGNLEVTVTVS